MAASTETKETNITLAKMYVVVLIILDLSVHLNMLLKLIINNGQTIKKYKTKRIDKK